MTTIHAVSAETPAVRPAQGAGWRDWGPSAFVAVVVAAVVFMSPYVAHLETSSGGGFGYGTGPGGFAQPIYLICGVLAVLGVAVGRWWPVRGLVLTVLPFLIVPLASAGLVVWGWWLAVIGVAFLAALDAARRAIVPFVVAMALVAVFCTKDLYVIVPNGVTNHGSGSGWYAFVAYLVISFAFVASAAAAGASRRSRARQSAAALTEQHAYAVESLAGERARIARDLHDVVAHHVSLVAVRAESAPFVHPDLDDDAREVLAAIATDAREALTELRQVLVVLQRTDQSGSDTRAPQPSACDVDRLVASAVAAGHPVEVVGTWTDVGPGHGYVLYRAVQEGLTNARRHAPGATTRLVRTQTDAAVGFTLSNAAGPVDDEGRGLVGMRERVEALGGTLTAAAVGGTFVLEVALPVTA